MNTQSTATDRTETGRIRSVMEKVRQIEIRTRRLVDESLAGHYHSVFRGRGLDFDSVREYVPGDEVRTIDWNVTARAGRPFVKQFREERELAVWILVDVSASGDFGSGATTKRELAAELACVLALSAVRNNDKVGLLIFSDRIEAHVAPAKGRAHALRVVREILTCRPAGRGTDIAAALDVVRQRALRRSVVFLISDFELPDDSGATLAALERAARPVGARHDVVAFEVPGEGHYAHTEIFAGYKNGRPTFIGSNNVNADGTQRISEGYAGYAIDAAFRYRG